MKKITLVCFILVSLIAHTSGQDSSRLRVSLLTCAPGDELYSIFGHTAIRITDSVNQSDIVYNYGTFDFNDPDFYIKFTRGKLDYMLSTSSLPEFLYEYQVEKRRVTEQVLQISDASKRALQETLQLTLAGPSRYYKYDFLYNNCTSRVRDLLLNTGLRPDQQLVPVNTTFRNMLHEYLDAGAQPWSKLGIDILLASPIDKKVNTSESMFLPDYLMKGIDSSVHSANGGVLLERNILNEGLPSQRKNHNWPLFVFTAFAVVVGLLSAFKTRTAKTITRFFDIALFLITGLLGFLLLFMWFGTDHKSCAYNYNLLWALPTNLVVVFVLRKKPRWLKKYLSFCVVVYLVTLLGWFWLPQQLNIALVPVVLLMLQRSWQLKKACA